MPGSHKLGNLEFESESRTLTILNGEESFVINLGIHLIGSTESAVNRSTDDKIILKYSSEDAVSISHRHLDEADVYTISWRDESATNVERKTWPTDTLSLHNDQWYGGPELLCQHWPIARCNIPLQPYISKDVVSHEDSVFGSFVERYFLNSKGISIVVDENTPLWMGVNPNNEGNLLLSGRCSRKIFRSNGKENPLLKYDIIVGKDVKTVHQFSMKAYSHRPIGIPDERMFRYPIWSTWARYKQDICQESVLEYAREIIDHDFRNSQLEIDDMWSSAYGDTLFDSVKFPNPIGMVQKLHKLDFRVTLWTTPFFNVESETLRSSLNHRWIRDGAEPPDEASFFVRGDSDTPALVKWWNGYGAMIDFTNPKASKWYIKQHKQLQEHLAIDSFKFDAGEAEFLPTVTGAKEQIMNSTLFTKAYAECVSKFGGMIEFRSGYRTQHLPAFVRMMDKYSNWSHTNGLRSLIPTCLTLGIVGYPFILPDMIGGNVYQETAIPSKELYIRWVEISAFMPAMQFSVAPWQYEDEDVVRITKKYVDIHSTYVTPIVLRFARISTVEDGSPIIRPIWWVNPKDPVAHAIDDEFLIGDEILVAPIVREGKTDRNIYLPGNGSWKWKDERTGEIFDSSQWLTDYDVPLDEVAYFRSIKPL